MFDRQGFREFFFREVGSSQNTLNTYNSYLGRLDQLSGGLDERIDDQGGEALLHWISAAAGEPLDSNRSQCKSIAKAYVRYRASEPSLLSDEASGSTSEENAASVFRFERELQAAVRRQLENLEVGFRIEDGGYEASFNTGRADILARDADNCAVVIELKAGPCPKGTLEQVLGYAQNWIEQGEKRVRSIVVAGSFSARQIAAAKLIPDLELKTYSLAVRFVEAEDEDSENESF